jgi:hypothetical protein
MRASYYCITIVLFILKQEQENNDLGSNDLNHLQKEIFSALWLLSQKGNSVKLQLNLKKVSIYREWLLI